MRPLPLSVITDRIGILDSMRFHWMVIVSPNAFKGWALAVFVQPAMPDVGLFRRHVPAAGGIRLRTSARAAFRVSGLEPAQNWAAWKKFFCKVSILKKRSLPSCASPRAPISARMACVGFFSVDMDMMSGR